MYLSVVHISIHLAVHSLLKTVPVIPTIIIIYLFAFPMMLTLHNVQVHIHKIILIDFANITGY